MSLKDRTISGVGWSFADSILGAGITFLVGIVLARLLSPDAYGLIGIITIFITVFDSIVDSGFSNALIRKIDVSDDDYNTMFLVNLLLSIVLFIVMFFSAKPIASFFNREELIPLIKVMSSIIVIYALSITQYTVLSKRLDFKTKTKSSVISSIVSGIVGIVMAILGFGVWSLVALQIIKRLLFTACLWFYVRWLPKIRFSIDSFRYMWGFGWKLLLSNLINNIWNELYQVVVGKCYSPATLGQYTKSREFARLLSANLTVVVQRVSFPALSELQNERDRMLLAYRKVIKLTMFVTCISMISMAAVAEPLLYCVIGDQWHEAATYLPYLCVTLSLYPLHAINLNMLQIENRSDIYLILEIVKKIISIIPIILGIFMGIFWMLIGTIIVGFICFFLNAYYSGKELNYSAWKQLKDVSESYFISLVIAFSVYFFKYLSISNYLILLIQILVGLLVFFILVKILKVEEYYEIKSVLIKYYSKIKNK